MNKYIYKFKNHFVSILVLALVATAATTYAPPSLAVTKKATTSSTAAPNAFCRDLFRKIKKEKIPLIRLVTPHSELTTSNEGTNKKLKRLAENDDIELVNPNFYDLILAEYVQIANSNKAPLKKSNEMAVFGEYLMKIAQALGYEKRVLVEYYLAQAVINLELIPTDEYVKNNIELLNPKNKNKEWATLTDFEKWTTAYLDDKAPYTSQQYSGTYLFETDEMRAMHLRNAWPVSMRPHDILHMHFTVANPFGAVMIYKAARSYNHRRYALLSNCFEGVDTAQFSDEVRMARYMRYDRGLNLQNALLLIARASERELDLITKEAGIITDTNERVSKYQNWSPNTMTGWSRSAIANFSFEKEIDDSVKKYLGLRNKAAKKRQTHYQSQKDSANWNENDLSIH